jgi:DNA-binding NarL/FixJ family response regulator
VSGRVLVVDDDPVFRAVAHRLLDAQGLQVVGEVATASDAYAAASHLEPDGILVDIGLPDGDGIALAHRLAALAWRPRVLLTSADPDAGPDELRLGGITGFVPKQDLPDASLRRFLVTQ